MPPPDAMPRLPPPDFVRPPVVEVALGVQFEARECLRPFEVAALRELWRESYPVVQEHPALPPTIETQPGGQAGFQVFVGPAPSRLWFLTSDGASLVQLQSDRLHVNWRANDGGGAYPRWDWVRSTFESRLLDVFEFVEARGDRIPAIAQVELTYINAIEMPDGAPASMDQLLKHWGTAPDHHLGTPREFKATLVYEVAGMGQGPVRLYLDAGPGVRPNGVPTSFLTLTVRGAPLQENVQSSLEFADKAHEHIVDSFAELTPPTMHTFWERQT